MRAGGKKFNLKRMCGETPRLPPKYGIECDSLAIQLPRWWANQLHFPCIYISILPYFSSYHGFVASDVHKLNGLAQSLILGRAWIRRDLLSHVFRWLRIAPLCDPAIALTLATVGLYVRKGGCVRALLPLARATAARQDQVLLRVWTPWITMITIPELFRAVECFLHSSAPRYKQQRGQQ